MPDTQDDEMRERVERIIEQILGSDRLRESSAFSERTYGDEPILRTGSDLKRDQDAREERRRERRADAADARTRTWDARGGRSHQAIASTRRERAERSFASQARYENLPDEGDVLPTPSGWDWVESWRRQTKPERVKLPATLRELRDIQKEATRQGSRMSATELFVRQAHIAADYEDDFDQPRTPAYRYSITYRDLSNAELRDYFSWRTQWRRGPVQRMPYAYVRLVAAELVNGVGAEAGEPTLACLKRLARESLEGDARGMGPNIASDLRQWVRDYAIYHQLDPKLVVSDEERTFASNVATLRLAECDVLARASLRDLTPADAPVKPPTDAELWHALGAISSYPPERSPFLRTHEDAAATVGAGVFRQLALHCAKRRKTCLVDGLLGSEDSMYYTPFLGLPFREDDALPDMTVRLSAAETVSHRFGRWRVKRGYGRVAKNRELGKLLRAIDRQMRIDWEFSRPLKERELPKYLRRMIEKESATEHEREVEAESRKITIDLSQLRHIRSAAAKTREALLVDEEREGYVPTAQGIPTAAPAAGPAADSGPAPTAGPASVPTSTDEPTQASASAGPIPPQPAQAPLGLSDLELAFVRGLLADEDTSGLFGKGAPMASIVVDSVNEKFFDAIGDTVIEFDDNNEPKLVDDYTDDVRSLVDG